MKSIIKYKNFYVVFLVLFFISTSCEDYLDKAPEASISEKDAYGNFRSFQGFVEELYNCVMDPDKGGAWNKYLFADETLGPNPYQFDLGNYWGNETYFYGRPNVNPSSLEGRDRRVWEW
ncbi:MAG: hypothetical protein K0B37_17340, partial [Bacteroidales bacterium]|nr:hypothetical protein [Bacteroidales bacterium]